MKAIELMESILKAKPNLTSQEIKEFAIQMMDDAKDIENESKKQSNESDTKDKDKEKPVFNRVIKKTELKFDAKAAIKEKTIQCCLCGKEFKSLTSKHLAFHEANRDNYLQACNYPAGTVLMSNEMKKMSIDRVKKAQEVKATMPKKTKKNKK